MLAPGKYMDELPKGNATYGFFPLWNPHSSLPTPNAQSSPAGTRSEPTPVLTDQLQKEPQASRLPAAERKTLSAMYGKPALMTVDGHTKRRILLRSMRYDLRVQSAPLVRGSSRRIMTLRFDPRISE